MRWSLGKGMASLAAQAAPSLTAPPADAPSLRARPWAFPDHDGRTREAVRTRAAARSIHLTMEGVLYLSMIVTAAFTRFWDLGSRALHHDESLHAYYSWLLATGHGYVHNPLMHGPFLFHANALVYTLFGASDASSRYLPALTGILLVATPWLLRSPNLLGRFGALAASFFLLVSPSYLYYTRYIRHDAYTAFGALLLFTSIVRYKERPERRWLVTGGVTLAFLFTNHEIVFALVAIFGGFLWAALLWGRLRPLLWVQIAAVALAGAAVVLAHRLDARPLPKIPWQSPTREQESQYYRDLLTNPLVVTMFVLLAVFLASCWWVIQDERRRRGIGLLDSAAPGTLEAAVRAVGRDATGVAITIIAGSLLFAALFTTLFTNLSGLATGTIATNGTLLYWLGQQGVQRGDQPWFYFLYVMPQYELFGVVLGLAGAVVAVWQAGRCLITRAPAPPRLFVRLFLTTWFGLIFLGLSYAGEKMPWLVIHITLPALLLAAMVVEDVARWWMSGRAEDRHDAWTVPAVAGGLVVAAGAWFLLAGRLTYGEFSDGGSGNLRRMVTDSARDRWWLLALPPIAGLIWLAGSWLWRGGRPTTKGAFIAMFVLLASYQIHAGWRLSYLQGDVPYDSLIYNTTSPDVTRVVSELGTLSQELTGGYGLNIYFDTASSGVEWPLRWYFRDYPNLHPFAGRIPDPSAADVVIVADGHIGSVQNQLGDFTAQGYILRWHEPEYYIYRDFAIAPELDPGKSAWKQASQPHGLFAILRSIRSSFATQLDPNGEQRVYRIVMYREIPATTMHFDFTVYVRNDLVPLLNDIRY